MGFGGHVPCGQTKGARKVIEHGQKPLEILQSGNYQAVPMFYGANLDEGLLPFTCRHHLTALKALIDSPNLDAL